MQNIWIWLVAAVVVIGGLFIWWQSSQAPAAVGTNDTSLTGSVDSQTNDADISGGANVDVNGAPMSATVTYSGTSFTPATVTVKKGGTVTFVDASKRGFWIASDEHPTHTEYDGTSRTAHCAAGYTGAKPFDECGTGSTYSFTFAKAGTIEYHDHMNANATGFVTVVE